MFPSASSPALTYLARLPSEASKSSPGELQLASTLKVVMEVRVVVLTTSVTSLVVPVMDGVAENRPSSHQALPGASLLEYCKPTSVSPQTMPLPTLAYTFTYP